MLDFFMIFDILLILPVRMGNGDELMVKLNIGHKPYYFSR